MPAARRSTTRRKTPTRVPVDPVWAMALDEIELQIKTLPANMRRGSAAWLRNARKVVRDAEKALAGGGRTTARRKR